MAYIDVESPLAGSSVSPTFTANGTYDDGGANVMPTCVLNDGDGNLVANGTVTATVPNWSANFAGVQVQSGLSIVAELPGLNESDEHGNIGIVDPASIKIDRIAAPALAAGVVGGAAVAAPPAYNLPLTGTYERGNAVFCLAMSYSDRNKIESVVGAAPAVLNPNPAIKTWSSTIRITPVAGKTGRLVIQAVMLNPNGKIMQSTARKRAKT